MICNGKSHGDISKYICLSLKFSCIFSHSFSLSLCVVYILSGEISTHEKKRVSTKKKFINVMILRSRIAKTGKSNILCQLFSSIRNKLKLGTYRTLTNFLLLTNGNSQSQF